MCDADQPPPDDYQADEYHRRVQAIVRLTSDHLSPDGIDHAQHLLDSGRPGDSLAALAWAIRRERPCIPLHLTRNIRYHALGRVADDRLPVVLDDIESNGANW